MYTSGQEGLHKRFLWSKTTLITGDVGGAVVDPPSLKTDTFFLGSLALREHSCVNSVMVTEFCNRIKTFLFCYKELLTG